jgi:hypothetical protein
MGLENEAGFCLRREREERAAASAASSTAVHDAHFVMEERYADRASSLSEQHFYLDQVTADAAGGMRVLVNGRVVTDRPTLNLIEGKTGK